MASRVVQLAKEASASKEKLNNLVQLLKCCASEDASECMAASKAVGHVLHQYSQVSGARGFECSWQPNFFRPFALFRPHLWPTRVCTLVSHAGP